MLSLQVASGGENESPVMEDLESPHTHMHTLTPTHTHTSLTHIHMHTHPHPHTHTCTHMHKHTHTYAHTLIHTHRHSRYRDTAPGWPRDGETVFLERAWVLAENVCCQGLISCINPN